MALKIGTYRLCEKTSIPKTEAPRKLSVFLGVRTARMILQQVMFRLNNGKLRIPKNYAAEQHMGRQTNFVKETIELQKGRYANSLNLNELDISLKVVCSVLGLPFKMLTQHNNLYSPNLQSPTFSDELIVAEQGYCFELLQSKRACRRLKKAKKRLARKRKRAYIGIIQTSPKGSIFSNF